MGGLTSVIDQNIGISCHAGYGTDHVAAAVRMRIIYVYISEARILIEDVELLGGCVLLEKLRCDLSFGGEDNAILCKDSKSGAGMGDSFKCVLDLV